MQGRNRTPDFITLVSGARRLYLVRDPDRRPGAVVPSFDVTNRVAALARVKLAGCTLVPIGRHAPEEQRGRERAARLREGGETGLGTCGLITTEERWHDRSW